MDTSVSLGEVLKLWDFMFAFGVHLNIIFIVARIVKAREEILKEDKPNVPKLLGAIHDANFIISLTVQLAKQIPPDLFQKVVLHTTQEI